MDPWTYRTARDHGLSGAARLRSARREPSLGEWTVGQLCAGALRGYLRLRHSLRVEGRGRLPTKPPLVVVANHASHLDALVLGAMLPWSLRASVFPIAAGDTFFDTPTTAALSSALLNALPMWRRRCGPHALAELRARLVEEPCGYILFPEGTRARDGQLGAFKPGVGMLVAGTDVPVVPCRLQGAFEAWPPEAKRPRRGRIVVRVGEPRRFADAPDTREGWERVASELHAAVAALAPPVT
jgi:1-acyl-sn-glycerol-3-phosphate acyltransferase